MSAANYRHFAVDRRLSAATPYNLIALFRVFLDHPSYLSKTKGPMTLKPVCIKLEEVGQIIFGTNVAIMLT